MFRNLVIAALIGASLAPAALADGACRDPRLADTLKNINARLTQVESGKAVSKANAESSDSAHTGAMVTTGILEGAPLAVGAVLGGTMATAYTAIIVLVGHGGTVFLPLIFGTGLATGATIGGVPLYLAHKEGSDQIERLENTVSSMPTERGAPTATDPATLSAMINKSIEDYRAYHARIGKVESQGEAELEQQSSVLHLGWNGIKELKLMTKAHEGQVSLYETESAFLHNAKVAVERACARSPEQQSPSQVVDQYDAKSGVAPGCENNACVLAPASTAGVTAVR